MLDIVWVHTATLQVEQIDLYQVHWPDRYAPIFGSLAYDRKKERQNSVPIKETCQAMKELIDAGKVRDTRKSLSGPGSYLKKLPVDVLPLPELLTLLWISAGRSSIMVLATKPPWEYESGLRRLMRLAARDLCRSKTSFHCSAVDSNRSLQKLARLTITTLLSSLGLHLVEACSLRSTVYQEEQNHETSSTTALSIVCCVSCCSCVADT